MAIRLDYLPARSNVLNTLRRHQLEFTQAATRLSSGRRVMQAGDDSAALAAGAKLAGQRRGWHQATQNVQNAISLLDVADGGGRAIHAGLSRLRELAVQAATGTYTDEDRAHIQEEFDQVRQAIFRTVTSTQFDQIMVLQGDSTTPAATVDVSGVTNAVGGTVTGATTSGTYPVTITQPIRRAAVIGGDQAVAILGAPVSMTITGPSGTATVALSGVPATWLPVINGQSGVTGVDALLTDATTTYDDGSLVGSGYLMLRTQAYGSAATVSVLTNQALLDETGYSVTATMGTGADLQGTINGVPFTSNGFTATAGPGSGGAAGLSILFGAGPLTGAIGSAVVNVPLPSLTELALVIQDGPNQPNQREIRIPSLLAGYMAQTGAGTLGAADVTTQDTANEAISVVDLAVEQVSDARTLIGAQTRSLEHHLGQTASGELNQGRAESLIMDADLAQETTELLVSALRQELGLSAQQAIQIHAEASLEFVVTSMYARTQRGATSFSLSSLSAALPA